MAAKLLFKQLVSILRINNREITQYTFRFTNKTIATNRHSDER
jgi:hypothetical protein